MTKVWFLGASFTFEIVNDQVTAIANRTCTIPAGTALFVPVVNAEAATLEGNGSTEAALRAAAASFLVGATNLSIEVDGTPIENLARYRVQSPLYTYGPLPDNNILLNAGYQNAVAGATSLSVADGVYVMLAPLSVGQHTIHFHAAVPDAKFLLDITYHIKVGK